MEIEEIDQSSQEVDYLEDQMGLKGGQLMLLESDKIVQANILKQKRKKRVKVLWFPKVQKRVLRQGTEPFYIYFLLKVYKSYEDEEYNKHKYFGYADAGIGMIDQLQLDKVYETVDLNMQIFSQGLDNFRSLIKYYKGLQDQMYFNLATALEEYQVWTNNHLNHVMHIFQDKEKYSETLQETYDSAIPEFEMTVKEWAQNTFPNELYEIEIGDIKFNQAKPVLKKRIFSKNLMMFIGGDLYEIYQKLIDHNLKESFSNFISGGEYNGKIQLEKTIKLMKWMMKRRREEIEIEDEVFTFDGISIPTKKIYKTYYYNMHEKKVVTQPQLHFIALIIYNFEPHWIRYLIETRQQFQEIPRQIEYPGMLNQNQFQKYKDFEYICKQEYFLEKFNYINTYQND